MAHIGAQVLDGGVAALAEIPVGVVNVPEGAQLVAGEFIQKGTKPAGIGIDAAGLDENAHALLPGNGNQRGKRLPDGVLVVKLGCDTDAGALDIVGDLHHGHNIRHAA